jgi:hypothetical protein
MDPPEAKSFGGRGGPSAASVAGRDDMAHPLRCALASADFDQRADHIPHLPIEETLAADVKFEAAARRSNMDRVDRAD